MRNHLRESDADDRISDKGELVTMAILLFRSIMSYNYRFGRRETNEAVNL